MPIDAYGPAETILEEALRSPRVSAVINHAQEAGDGAVFASAALLPLLAAVVYRRLGGPLVVAVRDEAGRLAGDLECFIPRETFHLPGGTLSGDWFRPYDEGVGRSLEAVSALHSGKVVVAGAEALLAGIPGAPREPWPLVVEPGTEMDLETMLRLLVDGGYRREYTVEGWGRFALRGGILDVFPSTAERPVRIELVGDRVESLREFNIVNQRSMDRLASVRIFPAAAPEGGGSAPPGLRVLAVDPESIEARARELCVDTGREPPAAGELLEQWGDVVRVDTAGSPDGRGVHFPGRPASEFRGDLAAAVGEWKRLLAGGERVFLLLDGAGQVARARELWEESAGAGAAPHAGVGTLSRGFLLSEQGIALFTSADLLGSTGRRRAARKASSGSPVASYAELEVGGHVVHADQGIGVYRGLTSREVLGVTREYLLLEYAQGDRLYVPTSQLEKVQRYVGSESPAVHRLRGKEWNQARRKARRHAEKTARELIQLYMDRKAKNGFAFSPDTPWQAELEDSFSYEDTPDQAAAVRDVKADMESELAMDRLICGDVGYGKTEVAVRAAMKAAMDSKQVAVLVPTTVLAKQHYETFRSRLAPFPVKVEMLSRFLGAKDQERVVEGARRGEVDVLIGTHRLLQDDMAFKDLGLLVVDEEQKFGVMHKEKLRKLSRGVDTLTLTATPIPRTLQMSLSGVRDISVIDTPPEDRHPVATYVGEFDMELARRAIGYEVARGGQVFYVHNRVGSIVRVAGALRAAMPGVSIAIAHGQMDEEDLERVMLEFAEGLHGVLVCTTIIESGLDLPNVNTLIVDRADRLGLSQLYQIRGRVGRALRRAFAYFFYPHRSVLTDTALSRLAALTEMTPLGSGMRVAMRDLEIRGAGNLLGSEQSGQIEAVGFELYCQLLREAVDILKGESRVPVRETAVELPVGAYIPDDYVQDQEVRVELYRRLAVAGRAGRIADLSVEIRDRFGDVPEPVAQMLELEGLRYSGGEAGLESVTMRGDELILKACPGEESILDHAADYAAERGFAGHEGAHVDSEARTLYLKLRFEDIETRQMLLLKWLKSIIDDIMDGP